MNVKMFDRNNGMAGEREEAAKKVRPRLDGVAGCLCA